jgi:cysteinyl-tRNA synthetase
LDWSNQELERARRTLDRLYGVLRIANDSYGPFEAAEAPSEAFLDALRDDLNTPVALAEFNRLARELANATEQESARRLASELLANGELIGLLQTAPEAWFSVGVTELESEQIEHLIEHRNAARDARNWAEADRIRDKLTDMGVLLEDADGTTRWRLID